MNKDNWKTQPQVMLLARATSEVVRLIAADVLLGIPYSIEELQDVGPAEVAESVVSEKKPASRRVSRRALAPVAEPELPEESAVDTAVPEAAEEESRAAAPTGSAPRRQAPARDESEVRAAAAAAFAQEPESLVVEEPDPEWGGDRG